MEIVPAFSNPLTITLCEGKLVIKSTVTLSENPYSDNIERREIALNEHKYKSLIEGLVSAKIPPIADFIMGLDGTTYSISFSNGFNHANYTWRKDCPKEWQVLGKSTDDMLAFVKDLTS